MFLLQASYYPAPVLGQGSDNAFENPMNGIVKIVVQRGETLWGLAQSHQTTVDEIVKLNKVKNPDNIREGESLWIPKEVEEEKPEKIEDVILSDFTGVRITDSEVVANTIPTNTSWWVNVLRGLEEEFIVSRLSKTQRQEPTIITYDIFVNQETPDPSDILSKNTLPDETEVALGVVQKPAVPQTASIGANSQSQTPSRSLGRLVSQEDVELLSRVIHGEARGEKFEGQVAVGAVVLNRLKDPRFPKTIQAVVYQSGAFTAVEDKQIQLNPNDEAYKAAEAALAGQDPTNGALFYFNPRLATDRWITTRPVIKRIGNHTFSI